MDTISFHQPQTGDRPKPPAPCHWYLLPINLPNQKLKQLVLRVDFRHSIIHKGWLGQYLCIFRRAVLQMENIITTLREVFITSHIDE
jgi:hypothetical protein